MKTSVAILGATGYSGSELIRLLDNHPQFKVTHLGAHSQAGKKAGDVLPGISGKMASMTLAASDIPLADDIELVFTALPHGAAAESVRSALNAGKKVVDLSADFRHKSPDIYKAAYQADHPCPELLHEAAYGLTEFSRDDISACRLVANPGCYPTTALLPLIPLLKSGLLDSKGIVIDAKTGISGAGRSTKQGLLYCEINEGVAAYGMPRHRHTWEMEEWAKTFSEKDTTVRFVPHILPMTRGMLATLHLTGENPADWHSILCESFADEKFVNILPLGMLPSTHGVKGSNRCDIGITVTGEHEAVVVSCIDNLIKGASGQAIQNANLMFGFQEDTGLSATAVWP